MFLRECQKKSSLFLLVLTFGLVLVLSSCFGNIQKNLARGEELLKQRKFQEAAMEFRAAADIDKNSADAHWGLARAREGQGDIYETMNELRQVVSLKSDHLEAKSKLGNYFLLIDPPLIADAEKIVDEIFQINPNYIEGHILKASILSAQEKPEKEIVDVLNHAISLDQNRVESYLSLARFYMKSKKAGEAESAIKKAISVNEKSPLGYLEYARFYSYSAKPTEAEAQFKKAIEVEPTNIEARESIAGFYLAQSQLEKAEQAFKDLVAAQGNSAEGKMQLAEFYASPRVGREEDAIATLEAILKDSPEYVRARYRLAEIHLERKETAKVTEQIEKLLVINDRDVEALMLRARLKMQDNKAEEAVKDLEEILKKQPSLKNALYYMAQARLALGQVEQARAFIGDLEKYHPNYLYSKLLKVQASFTANEPQTALQQANELLDVIQRSHPNQDTNPQELEQLRVRAISARGQAFLALGKINEARADLQAVLKLSPNSSSANTNLAGVELATKNYDEALKLYEKAFSIDKKNFDALTGIISVFKLQKQFPQAQERLDKVLAENTAQKDVAASLHYLKADVFTAQKDLDSAQAELNKSIEADSEYLPAYSAIAAILVAQNQIDAAIEQYKKVVEKKPSSAVYSLIGMLEDARNNVDEAEKQYRKALDITPENAIASNNLAWIIAAYDKGNLDEALQLAQGCVTKSPNVAGFYDTLGLVYFKKGLHAPAVEQFKKAISLDEAETSRTGSIPNPAYRVRLAMALASSGDKPNAKKEAEIALKREQNMSQQEAQEAKKLLGNL
ncbi:MAG TPA: tetratricopeptide repeat protein [Pyrinomonadaceae bacterium]|nr:tetratricopeptide repeat protein [Pyrinomonadaceae bacterium]